MKLLCKPENETDAAQVMAMLQQVGIAAELQSFHDTAYDGLFQTQLGWGVVRVDDADYAAAAQVLREWMNAIPDVREMEGKSATSSSDEDTDSSG